MFNQGSVLHPCLTTYISRLRLDGQVQHLLSMGRRCRDPDGGQLSV